VPTDSPQPVRSFARSEGRHAFASAAALYATARPGYPERVYEVLRDRCGLGPTTSVLEIGAGPGLATTRLLERAASVVAVEPNPALAEQLRARLGTAANLDIVVAAFEEADLPSASFDLVVSATAFHWLDPDVALPKIREVLRPGGRLALWWNVFGDPALPDAFHDATEPLLRDLESGPAGGSGGGEYALDVAGRTDELARFGFVDIAHEEVRWTLVLDPAGVRGLYATFSNIARLPEARRIQVLDALERVALDEFGGRVERGMVTPIYTARA
jgi:SAM-dependent methyltransferase